MSSCRTIFELLHRHVILLLEKTFSAGKVHHEMQWGGSFARGNLQVRQEGEGNERPLATQTPDVLYEHVVSITGRRLLKALRQMRL